MQRQRLTVFTIFYRCEPGIQIRPETTIKKYENYLINMIKILIISNLNFNVCVSANSQVFTYNTSIFENNNI